MPELLLAVGTYTSRHPYGSVLGRGVRNLLSAGRPRSAGVHLVRFDPATGRFGSPQLAARMPNPAWLAFDGNRSALYAVSESRRGRICAFNVSSAGALALLNEASSGGASPCYAALATNGESILVANYDSATVAQIPLAADGSMREGASLRRHEGSSINRQRQSSSHPHCIAFSPGGGWAYVPDLGADRVYAYRVEPGSGWLSDCPAHVFDCEPGSGPRHMQFHPGGEFAYLVNELKSTVTVLRFDAATGELKPIRDVSTLPQAWVGHSTASDLRVVPSGRFLYVSNRGHDSIAGFAVEPGGLTLTVVISSGGRTPRGLAINPAGNWLFAANQDSDNVVAFRVDRDAGTLEEAGRCAVPTPASALILL